MQAKVRAAELLKLGKKSEARKYFNKCVDVSHKMALELMHECRKLDVDCIVAPYEADSQLAFLNISGIADYVITEGILVRNLKMCCLMKFSVFQIPI